MEEEVEKGRRGQSFDDFLKEEGMYEEVTEYAVKQVIALEIAQAMKEQDISKAEMTRRRKPAVRSRNGSRPEPRQRKPRAS